MHLEGRASDLCYQLPLAVLAESPSSTFRSTVISMNEKLREIRKAGYKGENGSKASVPEYTHCVGAEVG